MKKLYTFIAPLCMAVLSFASCISDDEVVTSSECGIVSFGVGDIKSALTIKNASGNDSVVYRTIGGSEIKFNIDQINGKIYSVDSLPNWTDLSAVVLKFSAYGNVYGQTRLSEKDTLFYYISSGVDSVNLTKPLEIYAVATDGVARKHYTVEIFKRVEDSDTLEWVKGNVNAILSNDRRFAVVGDKVYAFYENGGEQFVSETTNGIEWITKKAGSVKYETITVFQNKFYALGDDSYIYASTDGENWEKSSSVGVERIFAADKFRLYAFDGTNIVGSSDMQNWSVYGDENLNMLPTSCISILSLTSKSNKSVDKVTMVGLCEGKTDNSVSWYKVSAKDDDVDQNWSYSVSFNNLFEFPYLAGLSATVYDDAIFAIGKSNGKYEYLYRSDDCGISWHPLTSKYLLPDEINDDDSTNASIMTVGDELWIIKGNNIWKGQIK